MKRTSSRTSLDGRSGRGTARLQLGRNYASTGDLDDGEDDLARYTSALGRRVRPKTQPQQLDWSKMLDEQKKEGETLEKATISDRFSISFSSSESSGESSSTEDSSSFNYTSKVKGVDELSAVIKDTEITEEGFDSDTGDDKDDSLSSERLNVVMSIDELSPAVENRAEDGQKEDVKINNKVPSLFGATRALVEESDVEEIISDVSPSRGVDTEEKEGSDDASLSRAVEKEDGDDYYSDSFTNDSSSPEPSRITEDRTNDDDDETDERSDSYRDSDETESDAEDLSQDDDEASFASETKAADEEKDAQPKSQSEFVDIGIQATAALPPFASTSSSPFVSSLTVDPVVLDALVNYSPSMLAVHSMTKEQLESIRTFTGRSLKSFETFAPQPTYHYTTLNETKQYIKKRKRKVMKNS